MKRSKNNKRKQNPSPQIYIAEDVPDNSLVRDSDGIYYFKTGKFGYIIKGMGPVYSIIFDDPRLRRRTRGESLSQELQPINLIREADNYKTISKPFLWYKRGYFQLITVLNPEYKIIPSEVVTELINAFEFKHGKWEFEGDETILGKIVDD